eukprot:COSAG06_NODE_2681_length_6459_cov_3.199528_6_plen_77_part_00
MAKNGQNRCPRAKMRPYAVLWHGSLIGIYSCAVDAAIVAKRLDRSTAVARHTHRLCLRSNIVPLLYSITLLTLCHS